MMKSNKQRRAEIKTRRLERAARLAVQLTTQNALALQTLRLPGMAPADHELLARYNNSYGEMPRYYLDRLFRCRECGAEAVWTARQQKWWYEEMRGSINGIPVRCLACRRARRARIAAMMAHEGANLLHEQTERLRKLGTTKPNAEARAEVAAALQSKWSGLRVVAVETLARWGGDAEIRQLEAVVSGGADQPYNSKEYRAARAAQEALGRIVTSQ
jgi:hypothetical protein